MPHRLKDAHEAEVAETERDPGLASLLDLPEATALVLHGAPGTTADDVDGFHDALIALLPLHDVIRTDVRAARVRDDDGAEVMITWTADADPRSTAKRALKALTALSQDKAEPAAEPAAEPVQAVLDDYTLEDEWAYRRAEHLHHARVRERHLQAAEREVDRTFNGPGIRGAYGKFGDGHR